MQLTRLAECRALQRVPRSHYRSLRRQWLQGAQNLRDKACRLAPEPLRTSVTSAVKKLLTSGDAEDRRLRRQTLSHTKARSTPRRYDKANEFTAETFVSFFLRVIRKGRLHHAAGMSPYLARRRGDRRGGAIKRVGLCLNLCEPPLPLR